MRPFGTERVTGFESRQSLRKSLLRLCKYLSRQPTMYPQQLIREFGSPQAFGIALENLVKQHHVQLEHELASDTTSPLMVRAYPSIS